MNCQEFREVFSDYLDDVLADDVRRAAEEHLAGCRDCASLAGAAEANLDVLADLPELDPGPALMTRLYAIPRPERKNFFRSVIDLLGRPAMQPALAALTVVMIFLTFLSGHPQGRLLRRTIDRELHAGYNQVEKLYAQSGKLTGEVGSLADSVVDKIKALRSDDNGKGKQ